VEIICILN